jgi:hypothetical protein
MAPMHPCQTCTYTLTVTHSHAYGLACAGAGAPVASPCRGAPRRTAQLEAHSRCGHGLRASACFCTVLHGFTLFYKMILAGPGAARRSGAGHCSRSWAWCSRRSRPSAAASQTSQPRRAAPTRPAGPDPRGPQPAFLASGYKSS